VETLWSKLGGTTRESGSGFSSGVQLIADGLASV
jgi:hypothetical protein